ncbi:FG-GAP-like repeat-containing protein [Streptomyces poriferorum]
MVSSSDLGGSTMRISLRSALVSAAAAIGLLAGVTVPAAAASSGYDRCPKGKICLFDGAYGAGAMATYSGSKPSLGSFDNKASSLINRTASDYICVYTRSSYQYIDDVHDVLMWTGSHEGLDLAGFHDANSHLSNNVSSFRLGDTLHSCLTGLDYMEWYNSSNYDARPARTFGDLNADGRSDLLFRSRNGRLWFLRGDGTGTLIGAGWNSMTALTRHGDLNGDGKEDLLARDASGVLWMYPGNGKGWFGTRAKIGAGWNSMRRVTAAGDLNGDGKGDLLAADASGVLWIYPGNGKGWFGTRAKIGAGWNSINALVGIGSFNKDTTNDLIARDTAGKLWLYPGNGKGWFGTRTLIGTGGWQRFRSLFSVGDATGDGNNDLFGEGRGTLDLYGGTGRGTLTNRGSDYQWDDRETAL